VAAYTNRTNLQTLLPSVLPADLTTALQDQYISDASAMVDSLVGKRFPMSSNGQKFNDITASPATPAVIELCARWIAAHFAWLKLGEINRSEATNAATYLAMAKAQLQEIREGAVDVYSSTGANLGTYTTAWSNTEDRDPTFRRGVYEDGELVGEAGTLDDLSYD